MTDTSLAHQGEQTRIIERTPEDDELLVRARSLAEGHSSVSMPAKRAIKKAVYKHPALTGYLDRYQRVVRHTVRYFQSASDQELALSYSAEWMLDNYYIILQTLREIGKDLPDQYYNQLPILDGGDFQGYPRIYALARELVVLNRGFLDIDRLCAFINAYQTDCPLTIGELWALPIMLRLAIVQALVISLSRITNTQSGFRNVFPAGIDLHEFLPDDEVVANAILSLRNIDSTDWETVFEELSLVEQTLHLDPSLVYPNMDFETRDRYRKAVEEIARGVVESEQEVSRKAVSLARQAADRNENQKVVHVGYYLIDRGRAEIETILGYQPTINERFQRWTFAHATLVYLGSIASLSALGLAWLLGYAASAGASAGMLVVVGLLAFIPVLTIAIDFVNSVVTHAVPPRLLPRLDYSEGIPDEYFSLVVIPALLTNKDDFDSLCLQLEQHYLRNSDPNLGFALLTDFSDAPEQVMPEDSQLIEEAQQVIQTLNDRHRRKGPAPFYLFHRERQWNPYEGVWMGWERKRGKLHELNQLIMGDTGTSYTIIVGEQDVLHRVHFVITLDADSILPIKTAARLVATLSHPLNRAEFAPKKNEVIAGYTIIQPRTEINPTKANYNFFTRLYGGDTAIDLYSMAVSDVYQDLFGEGSYTGKGIYDVRAFERSLEGRVPENALLSHDLFEGMSGRTALMTDALLIEDYPPNYLAYIERTRRWIRGDWQLLPWLGRRVPSAGGGKKINHFVTIDRWKIFDNLRRSLVSPVLLFFFISSWTWLPGSPLLWTLAGALSVSLQVIPGLASVLSQLLNRESLSRSLSISFQPLKYAFFRWLAILVFLPYEALSSIQAISGTLYRLFISRRHLLRWTTSAHSAKKLTEIMGLGFVYIQMGGPLLVTAAILLTVYLVNPGALAAAAPLLITWLLSPAIAYSISQPHIQISQRLGEKEILRLRWLARRTWLFFEQYVGPEDQWLPPDHYQESPRGLIAHRTSPTNIGLAMLSTLSAYDLGYLGLLELVARVRSSIESLEQLEKFRGHVLNWYDTRSLSVLTPAYVSTVDSGNLAIALISLGQGLLELINTPVLSWKSWQGLMDTLHLLQEPIEKIEDSTALPYIDALADHLNQICEQILGFQDQPEVWAALAYQGLPGDVWGELDQHLLNLVDEGSQFLDSESLRQISLGSRAVRSHRDTVKRDIELLMPWVPFINQPPRLLIQMETDPSISQEWQTLLAMFPAAPSLRQLSEVHREARPVLNRLIEKVKNSSSQSQLVDEAYRWCLRLDESLKAGELSAKALQIGLQDLHSKSQSIAHEMDFSFLFDRQRKVFHIGYNVDLGRLDNNYYDLLASEARIASLFAIAKGDVPLSHWLHLSRPYTQVNGMRALLSWSATMFEYLMPVLHFRTYEGTLLHQSIQAAVQRQIDYGRERNLPWGISESGYYRFDENQVYQYRAFGVPGLGFKRGLREDLVITPYASLLALSVRPQEVMKNIEDLNRHGMKGAYGFYEAIDFTPERQTLGERFNIVKSYMSHHQGMILVSLANYLDGDRMVARTHADPVMQSVDLLLQEAFPENAPLEQLQSDDTPAVRPTIPKVITNPWKVRSRPPQPRLHFLSNGRYSVMITSSGGGYSAWQEVDLTRWRPDTTLNNWGTWIYIQDREHGHLWSATYQPTAVPPHTSDVFFNAHMAQFRRRDNDISTELEITVHPEDDIEVRLVTLHNHSDLQRHLRITSYGEVVMARQADDERHPAFNKLFIQSEYLPESNALLFRRRARSHTETPIYLLHAFVVDPVVPVSQAYEASRAHFIGRGHTTRRPLALAHRPGTDESPSLTKTTGATLDPVMVLSQDIELEPHGTTRVALITLAADDRQKAITVLDRYRQLHNCERAFQQSRQAAELELRELGLTTGQLQTMQRILSVLVYPHGVLRANQARLAANFKGQPDLWVYGISGDYPILLVQLHSSEEMSIVHELLQAHAYWRRRRLKIDLVIINEQGVDYGQEISNLLYRLVTRMKSDAWINRRGGIFLISADRMSDLDRTLLDSAARVVLDGGKGTLAEQVRRMGEIPERLPLLSPSEPDANLDITTPTLARPSNLLFDNGLGGFTPDGCEYVLYLTPGASTPVPWSNVIANPDFGFLITESGSGFTWSINSGENRLTPWSNDPVSDAPGEAVYLRDEETGQVWTPTPLPGRDNEPYLVRHGAGYTIFEHHNLALKQQLSFFAAPEDPIKIIHLRLENTGVRQRRLTATYFAEWVLGVSRESGQQYVISTYDDESQAILARNPYNPEFGERVAFAAASRPLHGLTADREEFLGRLGSRAFPFALRRVGLTGRVGAGLDPCAALQVHIDLAPGETQEVYFLLGQGANQEDALRLVRQYQHATKVEKTRQAVQELWDELLGIVQVKTPEPSMDILLNRWLLYQALACRIWGRSAFYQSSGAYGFRDQLQDVMSLIHAAPEIAREHILRSTRHQFESGDVLHWWHPPSGRGVRTRYSDDLLWLPFVTAYYIEATGDDAILEEKTTFLTGPSLEPGEKERYGLYEPTQETYTVFEHCRRAIDRGATSGSHGLPLMGSGDWNDGMNRVGVNGKGESVWLGWFLYDTLMRFARVCERRGEVRQAEVYRQRADRLRQAIEQSAWDGEWYLRAFYDDGSPLGSAANKECQIDSIAQSWSILSGAGDPERAERGMRSVSERLVNEEDNLLLLFTPPFDKTPRDPGYIKGYLPGIRENGGQYTHAALWTIWAYTQLGQGDYATQLFQMINPIYHSDTPKKVIRYGVEPYVVAADVYSVPPHNGRGGWTWYTGSSGWMYRLGIEAILGLRREADALVIDPHVPIGWEEYTLTYRWGSATYQIKVDNSGSSGQNVRRVVMNGKELPERKIPLVDDGGVHEVIVELS